MSAGDSAATAPVASTSSSNGGEASGSAGKGKGEKGGSARPEQSARKPAKEMTKCERVGPILRDDRTDSNFCHSRAQGASGQCSAQSQHCWSIDTPTDVLSSASRKDSVRLKQRKRQQQKQQRAKGQANSKRSLVNPPLPLQKESRQPLRVKLERPTSAPLSIPSQTPVSAMPLLSVYSFTLTLHALPSRSMPKCSGT
jgi:hypothetical protein